MTAHLYAPESYTSASAAVRNQVVNGCGPAGWKAKLIPDTIWFLLIIEACRIHDWMYAVGQTLADKDEADRVFINNLLRLIEAAGGPNWLQWLRRRRAHKYYLAVVKFGGPAYWQGKNPPETLHPITLGLLEAPFADMLA